MATPAAPDDDRRDLELLAGLTDEQQVALIAETGKNPLDADDEHLPQPPQGPAWEPPDLDAQAAGR